jgi:hypothetical protein
MTRPPKKSPLHFQQAPNALVVLPGISVWPHSPQLVASATASLSSRALAVELLLVELLAGLLPVEPKRVTLLQVCLLNPRSMNNLLTHLSGNAGAAAGNGNGKANGGAKNNGQNAATGNTGAAAGNGNGNGNKKNNRRSVAGTRLARYVVVDQD